MQQTVKHSRGQDMIVEDLARIYCLTSAVFPKQIFFNIIFPS